MQTSPLAKMHASFAFYSQVPRILNWFRAPSTEKRSFDKASLTAVGPSKSMIQSYEVLKTHCRHRRHDEDVRCIVELKARHRVDLLINARDKVR